jgi:DNA gyrase subunit B
MMDTKIERITGADRVRLRPAVVFGSDGPEGALCAVKMLLDVLSADPEFTRLDVTRQEDGSIKISMDGQGLYLGSGQPEDDLLWKERFDEIPCSSAYDKHVPDLSSYFRKTDVFEEFDLCAVQYASEFMDVTVVRNGLEFKLHFEKGENKGGLTVLPAQSPNGSRIHFRLDDTVFSSVAFSEDAVLNYIQQLNVSFPQHCFRFHRIAEISKMSNEA